MDNNKIIGQIKKARIEQDKKQSELAAHLGKTAAAISDLERGKVQVSAVDLYMLAEFFHKPIDYFYGTEIEESDEEFIISTVEKADKNSLEELIIFLKFASQVTRFQNELKKKYKENDKLNEKDTLKFYKIITPYFNLLNARRQEALAMKLKIEKALDYVPSEEDLENIE